MFRLRLANVMGMDINNAQHGVGIADALTGITNPEAFVLYCREQKDAVTYSNRVEKLDTLATRYKKIEEEKLLENKYTQGEKYAKALSAKIIECRNFIEDNDISFSEIRGENKATYFEDHELRMLEKIGSQITVIEYSKVNRLAGEIYKKYVEAIRQQRIEQKSLPINPKVKALL